MLVVFYFLHGSRCFFNAPAPHHTQAAPCYAIVQPCQKPTSEAKRFYAGVGDTIAINPATKSDTLWWGVLIDLQE